MDRTKLMVEILEVYRRHGIKEQEDVLLNALRYISSDTSLLALAWELGINTEKVFGEVA